MIRSHLYVTGVIFFISTALFGVAVPIVFTVTQLFSNRTTSVYSVHSEDIEKLSLFSQEPRYFSPRPSNTEKRPYNQNHSASVVKPLYNGEGDSIVEKRIEALIEKFGKEAVGAHFSSDAITYSASGLDPHISLKNAQLQISRIAAFRKLDPEKIEKMVLEILAQSPNYEWALFPRVLNVIQLNQSLDTITMADEP